MPVQLMAFWMLYVVRMSLRHETSESHQLDGRRWLKDVLWMWQGRHMSPCPLGIYQ